MQGDVRPMLMENPGSEGTMLMLWHSGLWKLAKSACDGTLRSSQMEIALVQVDICAVQ